MSSQRIRDLSYPRILSFKTHRAYIRVKWASCVALRAALGRGQQPGLVIGVSDHLLCAHELGPLGPQSSTRQIRRGLGRFPLTFPSAPPSHLLADCVSRLCRAGEPRKGPGTCTHLLLSVAGVTLRDWQCLS
uniref:Uncharacterized protein n=1 Tax=Molossus molossus TaxID=27622 RepID=A0A7J8ESP3_MOLMO|nr:hypothetical protein HJG59_008752 [Molossus molossus]